VNGAARWLAGALTAVGLIGGAALYVIRLEVAQVSGRLDAELQGIELDRRTMVKEWRGRFQRIDDVILDYLKADTLQRHSILLDAQRAAYCAHLRDEHQRSCPLPDVL
jgi:hypothetical protein